MELKNLALGKEVVIKTIVPTEKSYASKEKGRRDTLTNGKIGDPSSCYGGDWVHFYRGVGRTLTVDLGEVCSVSGFDIGFIHDRKMGIYSPECVKLLLSENGSDFYYVASVDAPYPSSFDMQVRAAYSATTKAHRARYARVEFTVEVNAFCDELRIYGGELDGYEYELSGELESDVNKNSFADREALGGVYDLPLIYFGYYPEDERVARVRKEDFLPYVAYIDKNGEPIDLMFDGVLMLMVQGRCPSGGSLGYHGAPSRFSDWEYIIEELFADGFNLKALDELVGDLKSKGLPKAYKHSVYLTAPVPKISLEPFGDLNGDGIEEKLLSTDDCVNAYAAYVDIVKRRFDAQCFENIKLDGWFWVNESISRENRDDEEYFARRCVEELHNRGFKCVFIPYFQAGGCQKAESVGFDCSTMQPGISFQDVLAENPIEMMEDFTALCKKYGFGVELEIHHGARNPEQQDKYISRFDAYLIACMKNGMMTDTVHTYYQAAGPGVFYDCAYSDNEAQRGVYDKLYKFIKGTLTDADFPQLAEKIEEEIELEDPVEEIEEIVVEPVNEEIIEEILTEEALTEEALTEEALTEEKPKEKETETVKVQKKKKIEPKQIKNDFKKHLKSTKSFIQNNKNTFKLACAATAVVAACAIIKAMKGDD